MKVKSESEVAQSCPTLSDPMDWSLPGSSIHGIFQARVLEWGATAFWQHIKKQRHYFTNKGPSCQGYGFSSSHVWMWELDYKELSAKELTLLNCGVGEDPWESLWTKGDQSWVFIGRTDVKAETPILWLPDAKNWLIWKDPDAGKDWRQEKGMTEDQTGWMASLNQCRWVWVNFGSWWWTGRPGVLWYMGSRRIGHDWATELNWKVHEQLQRRYPLNISTYIGVDRVYNS